MAYLLERKATQSTPYVLIDEKNHRMVLEGLSFHENTVEFFKALKEWLVEYLKTDFGTFTFECGMTYFNSSTTKILYNMFGLMNDHASKNKEIIINWHINHQDDMLLELCEDFQEDYDNLIFNKIML